jgi:hypothetical protein
MGSSRLCFASTQASRRRHMPPPVLVGTLTGFWGQNPKTVQYWFWGPNHQTAWRRVSATPPSRSRHVPPSSLTVLTKSSCTSAWLGQPPSWLGQYGLLLRMYSCVLRSQVLATHGQSFRPSWSLGPNFTSVLHHSGPLHWYDPSLLDLQHVCRPSVCSTPAHEHIQEICCTHTHVWVSCKLNRSLDRLSTITHHNSAHKGIYEPCVRKTEDQEWKMKDERPAQECWTWRARSSNSRVMTPLIATTRLLGWPRPFLQLYLLTKLYITLNMLKQYMQMFSISSFTVIFCTCYIWGDRFGVHGTIYL